jgi:hypothetical protein
MSAVFQISARFALPFLSVRFWDYAR